jgi:hypothetical protein
MSTLRSACGKGWQFSLAHFCSQNTLYFDDSECGPCHQSDPGVECNPTQGQVATAVSFLSNDCSLVHGGVSMAAVVVTDRLDWKLSGRGVHPSTVQASTELFYLLLLPLKKPR